MSFSFPDMIIIGVLCLFGMGIYALLTMRNLIRIIVALQLLVKSIILFVILAGKITGQMALAQSMATTVIVADTIVAVLGMALAVQIRKATHSLDIKDITNLRR